MKVQKVRANTETHGLLLEAYAQLGELDVAFGILETMRSGRAPRPSTNAYQNVDIGVLVALFQGCVAAAKKKSFSDKINPVVSKALELVDRNWLKREGRQRTTSTPVDGGETEVVGGEQSSSGPRAEEAEEEPTLPISDALITSIAELLVLARRDVAEIFSVIQTLCQQYALRPTLDLCRILVGVSIDERKPGRALSVFDLMVAQNVLPDHACLSTLIRGCVHTGWASEGEAVVRSLLGLSGGRRGAERLFEIPPGGASEEASPATVALVHELAKALLDHQHSDRVRALYSDASALLPDKEQRRMERALTRVELEAKEKEDRRKRREGGGIASVWDSKKARRELRGLSGAAAEAVFKTTENQGTTAGDSGTTDGAAGVMGGGAGGSAGGSTAVKSNKTSNAEAVEDQGLKEASGDWNYGGDWNYDQGGHRRGGRKRGGRNRKK